MILNSRAVYEECGRRVAAAINVGDYTRAQFERGWFRRAIALEPDKTWARMARQYFQDVYEANLKVKL